MVKTKKRGPFYPGLSSFLWGTKLRQKIPCLTIKNSNAFISLYSLCHKKQKRWWWEQDDDHHHKEQRKERKWRLCKKNENKCEEETKPNAQKQIPPSEKRSSWPYQDEKSVLKVPLTKDYLCKVTTLPCMLSFYTLWKVQVQATRLQAISLFQKKYPFHFQLTSLFLS